MEETGGVDNSGFDVLHENMRASLLSFQQTSHFRAYATPRSVPGQSQPSHTTSNMGGLAKADIIRRKPLFLCVRKTVPIRLLCFSLRA